MNLINYITSLAVPFTILIIVVYGIIEKQAIPQSVQTPINPNRRFINEMQQRRTNRQAVLFSIPSHFLKLRH